MHPGSALESHESLKTRDGAKRVEVSIAVDPEIELSTFREGAAKVFDSCVEVAERRGNSSLCEPGSAKQIGSAILPETVQNGTGFRCAAHSRQGRPEKSPMSRIGVVEVQEVPRSPLHVVPIT